MNLKRENIIGNDPTYINTDQQLDNLINGQLAERVIKTLARAKLPTPPSSLKGQEMYNYIIEQLEYLDAKLSSVRKTGTFWDAYGIRDSAANQEEFIQKLGRIGTNGSILISEPFSTDIDTYARGDVVGKDFNGNLFHIRASQSGSYMPTNISKTDGNTYTITYAFTDTSVEGDSRTLSLDAPDIEELPYNELLILGPQTHSASIALKPNAKPLWECREYDNSTFGERLLNVVTVTKTDTAYTFTLQQGYPGTVAVIVR